MQTHPPKNTFPMNQDLEAGRNQNQALELTNSTQELLQQNNHEMEEVVAYLGEFFPEECLLEKLCIKELVETSSSIYLIHCSKCIEACTMNIRNVKNDIPAV